MTLKLTNPVKCHDITTWKIALCHIISRGAEPSNTADKLTFLPCQYS